jgi:hypothetical protein
LDKYFNIKISPSMIQQISEDVGKKLFEEAKREAEILFDNQHKIINTIPDSKKLGRLYIEADGSMVLIRGAGYKEFKLGMVFKDGMIINKNKARKIIVEKEYVAHLGTAEEFKKMLWLTAVRNGYQEVKEVVFLGDGAKWLWNMAKELFPDAVFILDYYHFEEHVYECANAVYPEDEIGRRKWAQNIIDGFMEGRINATIDDLNSFDYKGDTVQAKIQSLKVYLENNQDKLDYMKYKQAGYYIGSGAVESAHKHVLQQRLKLAGMRWSKKGAQYIATLRTLSKSNRWNKVKNAIYTKAG